jgi:hypothetical protein
MALISAATFLSGGLHAQDVDPSLSAVRIAFDSLVVGLDANRQNVALIETLMGRDGAATDSPVPPGLSRALGARRMVPDANSLRACDDQGCELAGRIATVVGTTAVSWDRAMSEATVSLFFTYETGSDPNLARAAFHVTVTRGPRGLRISRIEPGPRS